MRGCPPGATRRGGAARDHRPAFERGRLRLFPAGARALAGPGPHRRADRAGAQAVSRTTCCSITATPSRARALADYQALVKPLACDKTLAVYKVMNLLGFDGGGIGNHEFNYGLAYLSQVTGKPFRCGRRRSGASRAAPGPLSRRCWPTSTACKTKQAAVRAVAHHRKADYRHRTPTASRSRATLKVGIIGFTPPTIMSWDKRWLEGKVYTEGMRESGQQIHPRDARQGRRPGRRHFARRPG